MIIRKVRYSTNHHKTPIVSVVIPLIYKDIKVCDVNITLRYDKYYLMSTNLRILKSSISKKYNISEESIDYKMEPITIPLSDDMTTRNLIGITKVTTNDDTILNKIRDNNIDKILNEHL